MNISYIEKAYKGVIATAIALAVVASVSTFASDRTDHSVSASPTPTVQPR